MKKVKKLSLNKATVSKLDGAALIGGKPAPPDTIGPCDTSTCTVGCPTNACPTNTCNCPTAGCTTGCPTANCTTPAGGCVQTVTATARDGMKPIC